MLFWGGSKTKLPDEQSLRQRVNQLETRIEALELASGERHIAVLNAVEKVMNQFRARVRKRDAEIPSEDAPQEAIVYPSEIPVPPRRRMRSF